MASEQKKVEPPVPQAKIVFAGDKKIQNDEDENKVVTDPVEEVAEVQAFEEIPVSAKKETSSATIKSEDKVEVFKMWLIIRIE